MLEGGETINVNGNWVVVYPETGAPITKAVYDDGVPVPLPSRLVKFARDGKLDSLRHEIERGADLNARLQGYTALDLAIIYGHVDAALLLIESGANVSVSDDSGSRPIHHAVLTRSLTDEDSLTVIKALVHAGADPFVSDRQGRSAEDFAAMRRKPRTLMHLKECPGSA
jgi:ankyrin repeat protein